MVFVLFYNASRATMATIKQTFYNYSEQDRQNALQAIRSGSSIRATCAKYGVPISSVQDRLSGRVAATQKRSFRIHTLLSGIS